MEDLEVKIILISKLQMTNKSWDDNYESKELVLHNEIDHEIQYEKVVIQKFEVDISVVSNDSTNVLAQSSHVWAQLAYVLAQFVEKIQ